MLFNPIQTIVQKIIRPTRSNYTLEDIGSKWFKYNKKIYVRDDFKVPYTRSNSISQRQPQTLNIESSLFYESKSDIKKATCVVYLHGNIGGRASIISELEVFLKMNYCAVCFDFIGCGMSDGQYITLGHEEKHQIHAIIQAIKDRYKIKQIILYGRSMGASSALLYYNQYRPKNLLGMILDSPYCDMDKLLIDIGNNQIKFIPNFLISAILQRTNTQIIKRTGYSLYDIKMKPIDNDVPIYIFHGKKDQLISTQQIQILCRTLRGQKKLKILENESHNTIREEQHRIQAFNWIMNCKGIDLKQNQEG